MSSNKRRTPEARAKHNAAKRRRIKERKATDPEFRRRINKQQRLSANFGISLTDYQNLQIIQDNKCGICGLEPTPEDRALAVDHDHTTGHIRGLLCFGCNVGIGHLKDDVRLLQRAIDWITERSIV